MKIAGRKNDGAWSRTNRVIKDASPTDRTALITTAKTALGLKAAAAFADLQSLAAECGISLPADVPDAPAWITRMLTDGIPRQVWNGRFTFTTYGKVGAKYVANYQSQIHYFAKDLRRFMKYYVLGSREMNDVLDIGGPSDGNPGGNPDFNANT